MERESNYYNRIVKIFFIVIFITVGNLTVFCKEKKNQQQILVQKLDSLLSKKVENPFNGIVLIQTDGRTRYLETYGFANISERSLCGIENQFVVGSISKQFTGAIILQEYDRGNLQLHIPIKEYLSDLTESWADTVTVHHLLTHTHGIVALDKPTIFPVGSQFSYSQIGYNLLAMIAEKTSGKTFIDLSAELFNKCNMKNSFHPELKEYKYLTEGYIVDNDGCPKSTYEYLDIYPAAGSFISTAEDLGRWNQFFFDGQLLSDSTFNLMVTPQKNAIRNHPIFGITKYGYGITIENNDGIIQWGQTGLVPGFVSMSFYFPQTKTSLIILENIDYGISDIHKTFFYHTQILSILKDLIKEN